MYQEQELIGYSQVEAQGEHVYVRMIALHPDHQRKGVGGRLLRWALTLAAEQSKSVRLQVFKINSEAKRFYERYGFRVEGETPTSFIMAFMPNNQVNKDASR